MNIKRVVMGLGLIGMLFASPVVSKASEGYTVSPNLPENQDADIRSYISVSTDKDRLVQDAKFTVTNTTDEVKVVEVAKLNAITSSNGVIEYTEETKVDSSELLDSKYGMAQYMDVPDKVKLDAGESKYVTVKLDVPKAEGTVLGAVGFKSAGEEELKEDKGVQFKVNNEIVSVIGVVVNFNHEGGKEFKLGKPFVSPMPSYYAIKLPVENKDARIKKEVDIKYTILDGDRKELFASEGVNEYNFAPMSKANIVFAWEHDSIETDKPYIIKGELNYKDADGKAEVVPFEREFMLDKKDLQNASGKRVGVPTLLTGGTGGIITGVLLVLGVLIGLFTGLLIRKKRKGVESEEE